jgi:hypothetical protein
MKCVQKCFAACLLLLACATLPAQEIHFPLIQALAWIPAAESRLLPAGGRAWQVDIADASIFSFSRDREVINDLTILSFTLSYRRGHRPVHKKSRFHAWVCRFRARCFP